MSDLIKEIFIDKYPIQTSIKGTKEILNQMENCVCKIYKGIKEKGTGFFCKIPLPDKTSINVLVTNYHILNKEYLNSNKHIKYSMNNEENFYEILLDDSRKIYTNEELDVTFIEITKKDNIKHFLEIDEQIKHEKNFYPELFNKKPIYILHYQKGAKLLVSYGIINGINNNEIMHTCSTEKGSSGSPILSLKSLKVIGIHKGFNTKYKNNQGIFMKNLIVEFLKFLQEKKLQKTNSETNLNEIDNLGLYNYNNQNFKKNSYIKDDNDKEDMKNESTNDDNIKIKNDQNKDNGYQNKINEIYHKIEKTKIIKTKYKPNRLRKTINFKSKYLLENDNEEQNTNSCKKKNDYSEIKERTFEKYNFQKYTGKSIGNFFRKEYTYINIKNKSFKKIENINNSSKETIKKNKINNIKSYNQEQYNQLPEDH